jgi:hypothetical protein
LPKSSPSDIAIARAGTQNISDNIVTDYMAIICEQRTKCGFVAPWVFEKAHRHGVSSLKKHWEEISKHYIFENCRYLLLPIRQDKQWALLSVQRDRKKIRYYSPCYTLWDVTKTTHDLLNFLFKRSTSKIDWPIQPIECPKQSSATFSYIHVCGYAKAIICDEGKINFDSLSILLVREQILGAIQKEIQQQFTNI